MLYYPYLEGSGAPFMNPAMKGAFIGFDSHCSKDFIISAILEGLCFETRLMLEHIGAMTRKWISATGGLLRQAQYAELLANILSVEIRESTVEEATLLGAAKLCVDKNFNSDGWNTFYSFISHYPSSEISVQFNAIFKNGYIPLRDSLEKYYSILVNLRSSDFVFARY